MDEPAADSAVGARDKDVVADASGICYNRDIAPCGDAALKRPLFDCYVETLTAVGIVFGILALFLAACYIHYLWRRMRQKAHQAYERDGRPQREPYDLHRSRAGVQAGGMVRYDAITQDVPYAVTDRGAVMYAPIAVVSAARKMDVEPSHAV